MYNGTTARELKAQYCYANFPQYWRGLSALCAVLPPVERLRQERPFDYGRMRVHAVRALMAYRGATSQIPLYRPYLALADGATFTTGLTNPATGHFESATLCDA